MLMDCQLHWYFQRERKRCRKQDKERRLLREKNNINKAMPCRRTKHKIVPISNADQVANLIICTLYLITESFNENWEINQTKTRINCRWNLAYTPKLSDSPLDGNLTWHRPPSGKASDTPGVPCRWRGTRSQCDDDDDSGGDNDDDAR